MTTSCSQTTNAPLQGHVALPYWNTLKKVADESTYSWTPSEVIFPHNKSKLCFHLLVNIFSGIQTFSPWLINRTIPLKRINFTFAQPANSEIYETFFDAEIKSNYDA